MSESKHIPGPWSVEGKEVFANELVIQINCGGLVIAGVVGGLEEQAANARLIAAAPELLEALRDLQAYAIQEVPGGGAHHNPVWAKVADALAKAGAA